MEEKVAEMGILSHDSALITELHLQTCDGCNACHRFITEQFIMNMAQFASGSDAEINQRLKNIISTMGSTSIEDGIFPVMFASITLKDLKDVDPKKFFGENYE